MLTLNKVQGFALHETAGADLIVFIKSSTDCDAKLPIEHPDVHHPSSTPTW